jgi:hypothetical protein
MRKWRRRGRRKEGGMGERGFDQMAGQVIS